MMIHIRTFIALHKNNKYFIIYTKDERGKHIGRISILPFDENEQEADEQIISLKFLENKTCRLVFNDETLLIIFEDGSGSMMFKSQKDGVSLEVRTQKIKFDDKISISTNI